MAYDDILTKETKFFDDTLDIVHVCSTPENLAQAEKDFSELESIANNSECLAEVKKAKSIFYLIKEEVSNYKTIEYINELKALKDKLSNALRLYKQKF